MSVAKQKNASYNGNFPYENFVLTANNCYRYITVCGDDIVPIKKWDIELNRDEINEYTKRIEEHYNRGSKESLGAILSNILGKKGNVPSNTINGRKVNELNARTDGLYEGRKSERTSDNTEGNDSFGKPEGL